MAHMGPHPGGSHSHPQQDESHQVLPPAGEDETQPGDSDGDGPEDAEGDLLDAPEQRALSPWTGRGGSGGRTPGELTLK